MIFILFLMFLSYLNVTLKRLNRHETKFPRQQSKEKVCHFFVSLRDEK